MVKNVQITQEMKFHDLWLSIVLYARDNIKTEEEMDFKELSIKVPHTIKAI